MEYTIRPEKKTRHIIFGCKANTYYELAESKEKDRKKVQLIASEADTAYLASEDGVLSFETQ